MRGRNLRRYLQRTLVARERLCVVAEREQGIAFRVVRGCVVRVDRDDGLETRNSFVKTIVSRKRETEIVMRRR